MLQQLALFDRVEYEINAKHYYALFQKIEKY